MKLIGAAVPFLAFLLALPAPHLGNVQTQNFRVQVSLITVGVRVTDKAGREVPGLIARDFRILEDGVRQPVVFFSSEEQPLSLGILLDRSQSMGEADKLSRAKAAAEVLGHSGRPENELFFIPFDHRIPRVSNLPKDWERIAGEIEATPAGGGTRLYDAIVETVEDLTRAKYRRQVLVVITDGADQHSQHTLDQVIHTLRQARAQLYMIGYFTPEEDEAFRRGGPTLSLIDGTLVDNPRLVFERLADETGAESFFPTSDEALRSIAEAISLDLRTQYTLAYYPPNPGLVGTYRRIRVEVRKMGVKVKARPGYILTPGTRQELAADQTAPDGPRQHGREDELKPDRFISCADGIGYCEDFSDPASGWPTRADAFYSNRSYYLKGKDVLVTNRPRMNDFRASLRLEVGSVFAPARESISVPQMTGAGVGDCRYLLDIPAKDITAGNGQLTIYYDAAPPLAHAWGSSAPWHGNATVSCPEEPGVTIDAGYLISGFWLETGDFSELSQDPDTGQLIFMGSWTNPANEHEGSSWEFRLDRM